MGHQLRVRVSAKCYGRLWFWRSEGLWMLSAAVEMSAALPGVVLVVPHAYSQTGSGSEDIAKGFDRASAPPTPDCTTDSAEVVWAGGRSGADDTPTLGSVARPPHAPRNQLSNLTPQPDASSSVPKTTPRSEARFHASALDRDPGTVDGRARVGQSMLLFFTTLETAKSRDAEVNPAQKAQSCSAGALLHPGNPGTCPQRQTQRQRQPVAAGRDTRHPGFHHGFGGTRRPATVGEGNDDPPASGFPFVRGVGGDEEATPAVIAAQHNAAQRSGRRTRIDSARLELAQLDLTVQVKMRGSGLDDDGGNGCGCR
ncbi:hypothetical protein EDB80DRAFT_770526 [Ilyonectria destructans]|nr:hypothetical protein EDB80DRAFT_770526 [Ilyonectria destructans]